MERYIKWKHTIYSSEYDALLQKEIAVWWVGGNSDMTYEEIQKSIPYRTYRRWIIETELSIIRKMDKKELRVLELWSSNGWLSIEVLKCENVQQITSIDISLGQDLMMQEKNEKKIISLKGDLNKIDKIDFGGEKFDIILTHGTLHHLVDPLFVLNYATDSLLHTWGLIIINDSYKLSSPQLKINALIAILCIRLPKYMIELNPIDFFRNFIKIPGVILSKNHAAAFAHNHEASPFESISSFEDYEAFYARKDLKLELFQRFAAIPALFWAIDHYPFKNTKFVQKMLAGLNRLDTFLIRKDLLTGDAHLTIIRKYA